MIEEVNDKKEGAKRLNIETFVNASISYGERWFT
jgi:hypothetical protein